LGDFEIGLGDLEIGLQKEIHKFFLNKCLYSSTGKLQKVTENIVFFFDTWPSYKVGLLRIIDGVIITFMNCLFKSVTGVITPTSGLSTTCRRRSASQKPVFYTKSSQDEVP